jgi:hypothetical protein
MSWVGISSHIIMWVLGLVMKMDEGAAKKLEDEKKAQEQVQLLAEREAKEKEEKIREMEIAIAEMRGTALPGATLPPTTNTPPLQTAGDGDKEDKDEAEEDEKAHSESAAEEPQVHRKIVLVLFHTHYNHAYARRLPRKGRSIRLRTLGKGWPRLLIPRSVLYRNNITHLTNKIL